MEIDARLGFSTGALHTSGLSLKERLRLFTNLGCRAVELNFVDVCDLQSNMLSPNIGDELKAFKYISIHAPARGVEYDDSPASWKLLLQITMRLPITGEYLIFHPDRVKDFKLFGGFAPENPPLFRVAFENMDWHKPWGKTVGYMQELLNQNSQWGFCFDVNHAYTNDPSGTLAGDFRKSLEYRMVQVHLSGYVTGHEPLYLTEQTDIIRSIRNVSVPIIIESLVTPETAQNELEYISRHIQGSA